MDAVKFIEERNRMCKSFSPDCEGCRVDEAKPIMSECCQWMFENPERVVKIVEEWSATHPRKTRQSEFLKIFPHPALDSDGVIAIQPCEVIVDACKDSSGNKRTNCWACRREFWMQEVK